MYIIVQEYSCRRKYTHTICRCYGIYIFLVLNSKIEANSQVETIELEIALSIEQKCY